MKCGKEKKFCGTAASEGYAIGQCVLIENKKPVLSDDLAASPQDELALLERAIQKTVEQLTRIEQKVRTEIGADEAEVFESHILMVTDQEFLDIIRREIIENGHNAAYAANVAKETQAVMFDQLEDEYFRTRATDVRDIADRLIRNCLGTDQTATELPENAVVIAHDITPSDTAQLDRARVRAFLSEVGSKTSHSAIMARSLGIPAVLGLQDICKSVENGDTILVDGMEGLVFSTPSESRMETYQKKMLDFRNELAEMQNYRDARFKYTSGRAVTVSGNIGSVEDMDVLLAQGAQGVGLFRTEFLFMGRQNIPSEEEQFLAYQAVAQKAEGELVVVRTLDIGGDKSIPYIDVPKEENPFLGLRALRLCLKRTELLRIQIRALLRAAFYGNVNIMFPMIGALSELRQAKAIVEECKQELRDKNVAFREDTPVGMMIEIPSAAIMSREFAKEVDFFSIGTNDLVQYTLAVDRINPNVSYLYNPFDPAVLELIKITISAAHEAGIWCGMCGEFAADRDATGLLAQMELDEFSVAAGSILNVKKQLSKVKNVILFRQDISPKE